MTNKLIFIPLIIYITKRPQVQAYIKKKKKEKTTPTTKRYMPSSPTLRWFKQNYTTCMHLRNKNSNKTPTKNIYIYNLKCLSFFNYIFMVNVFFQPILSIYKIANVLNLSWVMVGGSIMEPGFALWFNQKPPASSVKTKMHKLNPNSILIRGTAGTWPVMILPFNLIFQREERGDWWFHSVTSYFFCGVEKIENWKKSRRSWLGEGDVFLCSRSPPWKAKMQRAS